MLHLVFAFVSFSTFALAADGYMKPQKEVLEVLNSPAPPSLWVSPTGTHVLIGDLVRMPSIADVSHPFLGLAGVRVNADTNSAQLLVYGTSLRVKELATGKEVVLELPPGAKIGVPSWGPEGKLFAVTNNTQNGVELLVGDVAGGKIRRIGKPALNGVLGLPFTWINDHQVLARTVLVDRGSAPAAPPVPPGPVVQEAKGQSGPIRTNPDMLDNAWEENLFDYYATSQLAVVDLPSGQITLVGSPGVFTAAGVSPDGKSVLVTRLKRPYSYLHPWSAFAKEIEVLDRTSGKRSYQVANLPLADNVPIDGVATGPRQVRWFPTEPSTVVWVEAVDGGDPRKTATHRDRILRFRAPFQNEPVEVTRTEQRVLGFDAVEHTSKAIVTDYDRSKRWIRTLLVDFGQPGQPSRVLSARNQSDRYKDPGRPVDVLSSSGQRVVREKDGIIWMEGTGATPRGDRPFLARYSLATQSVERVHESGESEYEEFVALASTDGSRFVTRKESPAEPPNYFLVNTDGKRTAITDYKDPAPQLRRIKKQLVRYKRKDGVDLQFTLYLPPDYKEGTRLPTILYAYPLEYTDSDVAGQVVGSTQKFTSLTGYTHLFCVLAGYAVLDGASMPVVGDTETVNNTYVEQISTSAKAAIDKAAEMGVTDPNRVGVIGHSYGAFMTANLLAHTDLFRAGVARSGAYNRTLTPFGFQSERRTYWQAAETYMKMSPFNYANKINEPILFIHGQADDNQGTFTVQSERMYQAVRGNGGTARLVLLPSEAHGYRARESVEHTLHEMITWFDTYVKNAGTAGQGSSTRSE
ncbi:MAG: S9 family peptidase [Bryobacteraceae bacterium]|nr:S9 family peptidase [Bryobacteraceae bacterium]